jgi:hypothetical protein
MPAGKQKCSVCGSQGVCEWVTIRVYRKRSQTQFRYFLDAECRQILAAFLEGGAVEIQRGLYDDRGAQVVRGSN